MLKVLDFPLYFSESMLVFFQRVMRYPWQMSEEKVRAVLQEALHLWSAVTPLRFTEVTANEPADIVIDFSR